MNFFEYQETARRNTRRLILYYIIAVVLIILSLYAVAALLFRYDQATATDGTFDTMALWDPALFAGVTLVTGAIILFGSFYKIASLSAGGEAVARMLGGRPLAPNTIQFNEKRLLNVVEEMAIASGTPIPRVFVLDQEPGINAFAAGFSPQDAIIGVTRGAIDKLSREELQGVIGHEFSHILNGDMRLNIRLIGVLNGILVIALTGLWIVRILGRSSSGGNSRDKKGNPLMLVILLGIAMMIIGYIGVFFSRLIKSAVSRQREFLADASAVQFTRNPPGLANALKKIGGLVTGSRIQAESAESASHLFFANGIGVSFLNLMATHPPLEERIRRLDPEFTGEMAATPQADEDIRPTLENSLMAENTIAPPPLPMMMVSPGQVITQTGTLTSASLDIASHLLSGLPASVQEAARTPFKAQAVLFGLLLDSKPDMRQRQLGNLTLHVAADLRMETETLAGQIDPLPRDVRAALASLATATLKHLAPEQYPAFKGAVMDLIAADSEVSLFEYMILRMIVRNLDTQFGLAKRPRMHGTSLAPLAEEAATVLSALAWFGTDNRAEAEHAFGAGRRELRLPEIKLLSPEESSLKHMDTALDRLAETTPPLKQRLIAAFTAAVSADGTITADEGEALRAAADALDCPIPPFG